MTSVFRNIVPAIALLWVVMALTMAVPAFVDWATYNRDWQDFVIVGCLVLAIGTLVFLANRDASQRWGRREGILFVNLAWLTISLIGALPLYFSDLGISFTDAFFESVSGLTTTGSTILVGLDDMSPGILLWRSILQWFGGIGFVIVATFLLPMIGSGGQQLFSLESSDTSEKEFGRFRDFAIRITWLYLLLTTACFAVYFALGMDAFNAINHAFTTVSTGGYSTSDLSMGQFGSPSILWASSVFMLLSSLPFIYLIQILFMGRHRFDPQILYYLITLVILLVTLLAIIDYRHSETEYYPLTTAVFHILSVVTTTGYAAEDYTLWHGSVAAYFFVITFLGGCSGSTAGGFKAYRFVLVSQSIRQHLWRMMYPSIARRPAYGSLPIREETMNGAMAFTFLFVVSFAVVALSLQIIGLDFVTAISASATAFANVGPGLGEIIGPAGNFQPLPSEAKWLLAVAMIVGRLEILAVYALALRAFWDH